MQAMVRFIGNLFFSGLVGLALGLVLWSSRVVDRFELRGNYLGELYRAASQAWRAPNLVDLSEQSLIVAALAAAVLFVLATILGNPHKRSSLELRGATLTGVSVLRQMTDARTVRNRLQRAKDHISYSTKRPTLAELWKAFSQVPRQTSVAGVKIPLQLEPLHFLLAGSTGAGKTQALRELMRGAQARGDRMVVVDPNGDYYSIFGREQDLLLNPFDARSPGWSIFNEIRSTYDCERYARSVVPEGHGELKAWNGYAQFLLRDMLHKLHEQGCRDGSVLVRMVTEVGDKELKDFLANMPAAGFFREGADRSTGSTRFILSKYIAPHKFPLQGDFSLRRWLETGEGNVYITWREDMADALRPLISTWFDILITSTLSMPIEKSPRPVWFFCDELGSLEQLSSLEAGLTKGRKHGARFCCGIQSTAQLSDIYGKEKSTTLRSCFRNGLFLNIPHTDPETAEQISKGLGDVERIRRERSRSIGFKSNQRTVNNRVATERLVMPAQIHDLPNLHGYLSLAGGYPVAQIQLRPRHYEHAMDGFVQREELRLDTRLAS